MSDFLKSRDWKALAKQGPNQPVPVPAGYVYIGSGDSYLGNVFGGRMKGLTKEEYYEGWQSGVQGSNDRWCYAAPIEIWEDKTKLNYKEIMNEPLHPAVYTKYSKSLSLYVQEILLNKERKDAYWGTVNDGNESFIFLNPQSMGEYKGGYIVGATKNRPFDSRYKEVSASELLAVLEALPNKQKDLTIQLDQIQVKVSSEKVIAGCQEYSYEDLSKIAEKVEEFNSGLKVNLPGKKEIVIDKDGVFCDQRKVSFAEFDLVLHNMKKLKESC